MSSRSECCSPGQKGGGSQAAHWFSRHESAEPLSPDELTHWESWIADPDNRAQYDGLVSTLCELKAHPRPCVPTDEELHSSVDHEAAEFGLGAGSAGAGIESSWRTPPVRGGPLQGISLAAALVAAVSVMLLIRIHHRPTPGSDSTVSATYATARGEQRDFALPDASMVTLAGESHLSVRFTRTQRIAVLDHGEGRFQVHHDAQRPFSVMAGRGSITAVGTVFDVRRYSDRIFVTVTEGVVEVVPAAEKNQSDPLSLTHPSEAAAPVIPLRVERGQEIAYDLRGEASAARRVDTRISESWVQGTLAYRGCPLREVIEDVQRYSIRHIALDSRVADFQYTGTFVAGNLEQWLRGLDHIFPVEVVESGADLIFIGPKSAAIVATDAQY